VQISVSGGAREAPSLAALSAALFPGILKCPGTQRIHTAPGRVYRRRARKGHFRATLSNSAKIDYEEPIEGLRSLVTTSRLLRKTQRSIANLAEGVERASFALVRAAEASILKTSVFRLRENAL
jgi:hypothetical protein